MCMNEFFQTCIHGTICDGEGLTGSCSIECENFLFKDDLIKLAKITIETLYSNEGGNYSCYHCRKNRTVDLEKIEHTETCPVLVAKKMLEETK